MMSSSAVSGSTVCSIHLVDGGVGGFLRSKAPKTATVPGMLSSQRLTAAPFTGKLMPGVPDFGRNGFLAFWESDDAITKFLDSDDAGVWAGGWHVRTNPIRAVGRWPGLPADIERKPQPEDNGPVLGITIGPLRLRQGWTFNKLNTKVEAQLFDSPGVLWCSAFFAPKTTTCSLTFWESADHLHDFARSGAHLEAMKASLDPGYDPSLPDGTKFFSPDLLFMSMRPYQTGGTLAGKNPIAENVFGSVGV